MANKHKLKSEKQKKEKKQRTLKQRIIWWAIGIVVFVIALNVILFLIDKFIRQESYEFTVKWGILYPIMTYFVLTVIYKLYKSFND
jgi:multisubunit Na+/H+ antiporter MnhB subunit